MGRQTAGVQGMKFRGDDELLAMDVVPEDSKQDLLVVTNEGFAKRTAISEYRLQGRNGGALIVSEDDQVMAIMKSGKVIRSNVTEVKRTGRTTQGVTLAKPDKGDEIISIARNEETGEDEVETTDDTAAAASATTSPDTAENTPDTADSVASGSDSGAASDENVNNTDDEA